MAKIVGKTFDHRDALKALGAKWDGNGKFWTIPDYDVSAIDKARQLNGVIVTDVGSAEPFPKATDEAKPAPSRSEPTPSAPARQPTERVNIDPLNLNDRLTIKTRLSVTFETLGDMVDAANRSTGRGSDASFAGVDYATAVDYARNGWSYGIELAERASTVITGEHVVQRQRRYAVAGGRANVGRMLSGSPLHMVSRPRQPSSKVITLYVDTVASSLVTSKTMVVCAACVAAIVDVLESNGYSAEIISVCAANARNDRAGWSVLTKLKSAGEPLNLNDVIFGLGHPAMLRQLVFKVVRDYSVVADMHGYMGTPVYADPVSMENGEYRIPLFNTNLKSIRFEDQVREIFGKVLPEGLPVKMEG